MNRAMLRQISMNGRMAYAIMTIERYLPDTYPSKDWSILSAQMWRATATAWDTWTDSFIEIIPEYLFEFPTYEESGFEHLSSEDHKSFAELYSGVTSGDSNDTINIFLESLRLIEEVYCYTSISGFGEESLDILEKICDIVEDAGIQLPDPQLVAFSPFTEKDGWGEDFDGTYLSAVLTSDKRR